MRVVRTEVKKEGRRKVTNIIGAILMVFAPNRHGVDFINQPRGTVEAIVVRGTMAGIIRQPRSKQSRHDFYRSWEALKHATTTPSK